jgi:hypothetical protein
MSKPSWLMIVAAVPAAVMLWALLAWNPKSGRQWLVAIAMMGYVAFYYFVFIR